MNNLYIILLFSVLTGCGQERDDYHWDPRTKDIISQFAIDADQYGLNGGTLGLIETIDEGTLNTDLGHCTRSINDRLTTRIIINSTVFESPALLRKVVYHELTHCAYHISGHFGELGDIMNIRVHVTSEDWSALVDRHFTGLLQIVEAQYRK